MFEKITEWFQGCKKASVEEVHELLRSPEKDKIAFIDVRRGDEWNTGYAEGFNHIALVDLPLHLSQLSSYEKVYFMCRGGVRSEQACAIMKKAGYENAFSVSGGILAWHKKGYPVVRQIVPKD